MERDRREHELAQVEAAVAGDAAAFESLYRSHVARIHSLARRLLGPARADDVTQEAFLLAWRKLDSFGRKGSFGGWLFHLARNRMLTEIRQRHRAGEALGLDEIAEPEAPAVEPGRRLDVDSALDRLPLRARHVLALWHFAGCSHGEIADLLGISVGTSKSQLHRARLLLRESLGDFAQGEAEPEEGA